MFKSANNFSQFIKRGFIISIWYHLRCLRGERPSSCWVISNLGWLTWFMAPYVKFLGPSSQPELIVASDTMGGTITPGMFNLNEDIWYIGDLDLEAFKVDDSGSRYRMVILWTLRMLVTVAFKNFTNTCMYKNPDFFLSKIQIIIIILLLN